MAVGPNLPHNWVSDLEPGEIVRNRDVVLQFDAALFTRAGARSFRRLRRSFPC